MEGLNEQLKGLRVVSKRSVGEADTACVVGSGGLEVLATPRLVAWMEADAYQALEAHMASGYTSVGTLFDIKHLSPSPIGATVEISTEITAIEGRTATFLQEATCGETLLAKATHARVLINAERFMAKVAKTPPPPAN